jgi:hypothetical protein
MYDTYHLYESEYSVTLKHSLKISVWSHIASVGHFGCDVSCTTLAGHTTSVGENP